MRERGPVFIQNEGERPDRDESDNRLHEKVENTELVIEKIPPKEAEQLERDFHESPEIQEYLAQPTNIVKIEQINSWLKPACAEKKLDAATTEKILETVASLLDEVKRYCRHYGQTVQKFEHIRRGRFRMMDRVYAERMARADQDRRVTHDTTLGALRSFNEYVSVRLYKEHGIDVPKEYFFDDDRIFVDRQGYGTEWVQTTDYFLQARSLIEDLKKEGSEHSSDPNERPSDQSDDEPGPEPK